MTLLTPSHTLRIVTITDTKLDSTNLPCYGLVYDPETRQLRALVATKAIANLPAETKCELTATPCKRQPGHSLWHATGILKRPVPASNNLSDLIVQADHERLLKATWEAK